jgi:hypothetical protein
MHRLVVTAILVLLAGTFLGGTVFRAPVGYAATALLDVFVTNDTSHPVPVSEQNKDATGNIKVHEQGTANVNVANSSLSVTAPVVTSGAGAESFGTSSSPLEVGACPCTASAIVVTMTSGVSGLTLFSSTSFPPAIAANFVGPALGGASTIVLPLPRPITFIAAECKGPSGEGCTISEVGDQP